MSAPRTREKAADEPQPTTCVGCYHQVRPGHPTDHAKGCPTGQNGTPNYS